MKIEIDGRFKRQIKGRFGAYDFEVGVLEDKPYREPKRGARGKKGKDVLSSYAGGPIRQKSNKNSGLMISDVSRENRERLGFNYLSKPFEKKSSDIIKFSNEFFRVILGKSQPMRLRNLLQAIVRNPILRGDYGPNSPLTKQIKGFDRAMIDTAQLFRNLTARVNKRGSIGR